MQHERHALGGAQCLEHDQQGQPDRVGDERLLLGVGTVAEAHDGVGHMNVGDLLGACPAGSEHVQADPADDRGQPRLHVLDARRILTMNPKPRLLEGIVGFAHRSEHAVGDRAEMRSVVLEALTQPRLLVHRQLGSLAWDSITNGCGSRAQ